MKGILALGLLSSAIATARAAEGDAWRESLLIQQGLRHSDIALMPEGTPEDFAIFAPLRPAVV